MDEWMIKLPIIVTLVVALGVTVSNGISDAIDDLTYNIVIAQDKE